jgi:hypothetical protein
VEKEALDLAHREQNLTDPQGLVQGYKKGNTSYNVVVVFNLPEKIESNFCTFPFDNLDFRHPSFPIIRYSNIIHNSIGIHFEKTLIVEMLL